MNELKNNTKSWIKAAGIRAVKTVAQTAVATIGTSAALSSVDWRMVVSASILAGILSILTSIAGLPELKELKKERLKNTVEMMNSEDYKERFKAEYQQVVIRYQKLSVMLEKWDKGELNFKPVCPRSTYNMQIKAMTDYIAILEARAVMEGIEL